MSDPIEGFWFSNAGSKLELQVNGSELTGFFNSTQNPIHEQFPLYGSIDPDAGLLNRALSFSVSWIIENIPSEYRSVTSYTGQSHKFEDNFEVLNTIFLLVDETSPQKQYASTLIGYDNFSRTEPSSEDVKRELLTRSPSHNIISGK